MALAEQLKASREKMGLSQSDVATRLNITRQSISKWENGKGYPDLDNLVLLSEVYEVSIDELLKENNALKKKIEANNDLIEIKKRRLERLQRLDLEAKPKDDSFLLLVLSLASCWVPILGVVLPIFILKMNKTTNAHYKLVKVISICCLLVSIYNTVLIANNMFFHYGEGSVQYID